MAAPIWVVAEPLQRRDAEAKSSIGGVSASLSDRGESEPFRNPFRDEDSASKITTETLPRPVAAKLGLVQFDGIPLADAMKVFSAETGLNVLCSSEAGQTPITVYLRDVAPIEALAAIVKANGLFYRIEENSQIVRIATAAEYEKDLTSFRDEKTRVFTLLYPNPVAVAQVIAQVFGDRVDLQMADADVHDLSDLSQRFNRFDLMDGRSLGLGNPQANQQNLGANNLNQLGTNALGLGAANGLAGAMGPLGLKGSNLNPRRQERPNQLELSADEIQALEDSIARDGDVGSNARSSLMQRGKATIFVSTIRRNNQIVVRTGDERSMEEIEKLVAQLDVPTPTVMLEVKVLRVSLAEGIESAFEYFAGGDDEAVGFSDGSLLPTFPGGTSAARQFAPGLGVSGKIPGSLTFQVVDENFQFRMQLLESQARVTALATPLILTANNEVSRIFVGDTLPFTVGFTPSQVVGGFNSVTGAVAATPVTELRDVGQSLLITPNINADRTVTLRIVEENSERVLGGASIPVPDVDGSGVTAVNVDTVRRRTLSGTVVAQDGMAVALGGLIEESVVESKDQVPVLGDVPGLGFLFRRQTDRKQRSELIVVIRPYVFNTPSESAATSEMMLEDLSLHPNASGASGTLNTYMPCEVVRTDAECVERARRMQLHTVRK